MQKRKNNQLHFSKNPSKNPVNKNSGNSNANGRKAHPGGVIAKSGANTARKRPNIPNAINPQSQKRGLPSSQSKNPSSGKRIVYERDEIFWCTECNLPLIGEVCGTCGKKGVSIILSQPADVRFCSPYEREVLSKQLISAFGCDPLGKRLILLNRIPGEDKTDEVLVDGRVFGILRFELSKMDYSFEPSLEGAKVLLQGAEGKRVSLKKINRHLAGKNIGVDLVDSVSENIKKGDFVLITAGNLSGYGVSYFENSEFARARYPAGGDPAENPRKALKIKKLDGSELSLNPKVPDLEACIQANRKHLQTLGKNAINTIKGIANQNQNKALPVYVSFSGGKDSLVVLDLTRSALKNRAYKAFFLNTGIEFPETVEFARGFCKENAIPFEELNSGSAFWEQVEKFGPPAKDFRWCCKVCKLATAGDLEDKKRKIEGEKAADTGKTEGEKAAGTGKTAKRQEKRKTACSFSSKASSGPGYLTIDGKRKYESFSRAQIAASETNPFVPDQLNIFPIRDWRALEVWLYIYWRKLPYNPLYDAGFERVGCWLCPAALSAEYVRVAELHPEMYAKWNAYLLQWAKSTGLSEKFIEHGFWRWKELPPKMLKLAEELGISTVAEEKKENFEIEVTAGISPCKAGGFSVEASIKGLKLSTASEFLKMLGKAVASKGLGMLLVKSDSGTIKLFSNGSLLVSAGTKATAIALFKDTAKQLVRASRCTLCGICVKACPAGAVSIDESGLHISGACIRCGKCTESCVVTKYFDKLSPDFEKKLKIWNLEN